MEPSKKVWQPPSKQKQPVVSAVASQSSATNSCATENNSHRTSSSSTRPSARAADKPTSVSSRELPQDSALKISSANHTSHSRNGERTKENSKNGTRANKSSMKTAAVSTDKTLPISVPHDAADANSQLAPSEVKSGGNRRLSDVNEPTKQPVAARLAAWKKKTAAVDDASTSNQCSALKDKLPIIREASAAKKHMVDSRAVQVGANISSSASSSTAVAADAVSDACGGSYDRNRTSFPPLKDGEVRQRTLPRCKPTTKQEAVQPSWKKLGPATFEIQQKLTAMCENWKRNEIAEKSRKERAEDLAVLENRWSNGLLADQQKDTAVTSATYMPSTVSEIVSHSQVH